MIWNLVCWFGIFFLALLWAINLVISLNGDSESIYLAILITLTVSLLTYVNVLGTLNAKYILFDEGIKSGQMKNKEYTDVIPWHCIREISLREHRRSSSIVIIFYEPIHMRFGLWYAEEDDVILNTNSHKLSNECLLKEIELYKQIMFTRNG